MLALPEMKHNRFEDVDIPKPSELYKRSGKSLGSCYSGDTVIVDDSKLNTARKVMADAEKIAKDATLLGDEPKDEPKAE